MGKIVISTNLSLDGVVQDPDGQEGFEHGGWFGRYGGADLEPWGKVMLGDALAAEALLLGRRTDEWFASRWNTRTGEWADRLNGAAQVRGVVHRREGELGHRNRDGPAGRRGRGGLEAEAGGRRR